MSGRGGLFDAPAKPEFAEACNGCGVCCLMQTCAMGLDLHGETKGPCPSLTWRDGRFWCDLVSRHPMVPLLLGIGVGCDSDAPVGTVAT